jgi:hypothetical protein
VPPGRAGEPQPGCLRHDRSPGSWAARSGPTVTSAPPLARLVGSGARGTGTSGRKRLISLAQAGQRASRGRAERMRRPRLRR